MLKWFRIRGGFRGGGGRTPFPSGIRHPADPKGPPLVLFKKSTFKKSTIFTTFEGGKRNFLVKIFQKVPKNAFFDCFFSSKICLRRRKFCQSRGKTVFWESSKNQFGRPKKKAVKIFDFFLKIRPPLEKILDMPLFRIVNFVPTESYFS